MAITPKTLLVAAVAAVTLGADVAATTMPAQASDGFSPCYRRCQGPVVGYAAGAIIGNTIAAGSYPYYRDPDAGSHGYAPFEYPYSGYGYYYGY